MCLVLTRVHEGLSFNPGTGSRVIFVTYSFPTLAESSGRRMFIMLLVTGAILEAGRACRFRHKEIIL